MSIHICVSGIFSTVASKIEKFHLARSFYKSERLYTYPCGWLGADVNRDSSCMSYLDSGPHHVNMFNLDLTTTGDISAKFHHSK